MRVSWNKLKGDIKKKYEDGELLPIYTIGRKWTPEEILKEVEDESEAGIEFMMAEHKYQQELKKRNIG